MKRFVFFVVAALLLPGALAQQQPGNDAGEPPPPAAAATPNDDNAAVKDAAVKSSVVTLPAGTRVLLVLKNAISSRTARPGDAVYLQTSFPVVQDGYVAIPAGTYVQGVVDSARRSGRVKGRAEIQMHFTRLVYPNGYMVSMVSSVGASDSSDTQRVEDKEGTVRAEGTKGRDAATVATATGVGTVSGGLGTGTWRGAGIGAGIGAGVGLLTTMLTRGNEVRFEPGSTVDMVLQRPIAIDVSRVASDPMQAPPPPQRVLAPPPQQSPNPVPMGIPRG